MLGTFCVELVASSHSAPVILAATVTASAGPTSSSSPVGPSWFSNRRSSRDAKQKHRILFITEGKTYCISMIRLDEKDRGIIEDFWSKGGDERMHMTPKNLSDGQCWKIVRLSRSPVPREFALDYRTDSVPEHQFMRWKRGGVCTCATTAASLRCTRCSRSHSVGATFTSSVRRRRQNWNLTLSNLVAIGPPARINFASDKSVV